ncbi:TPA: hypothetical protein QFF28_000911 [Enterococcus faecium]
MNKLKEKISEVISTHISLDDTYTYELTRVKSAFEVGTISLEDFEEWSEKNVDDLAEAIVCALQPQLNDNQKIVLDHLKKDKKYRPFRSVGFLDYSNGVIHDRPSKELYEAYKQLDYDQQFEVLAAFAQWGLEQEEAE